MFTTLKIIGVLLQVLGALIPIGSVALGVAMMQIQTTYAGYNNSEQSAFSLAVGGVMLGVLLYAFGGMVRVAIKTAETMRKHTYLLEAIERNTLKSAMALEALARRRQQ